MVAICASANVVHPWCGAVIGGVGGIVAFLWSIALHYAGVDDAIDAISVHLGSGLWGVMAVPLFSKVDSIFYHDSSSAWTTMAWNVAGALVIIVWVSVTMLLFFGTLQYFGQLRIESDFDDGQEIDKLEHPHHPAYVMDGHHSAPMVQVIHRFAAHPSPAPPSRAAD